MSKFPFDNKMLTDAEWCEISPETRHKICEFLLKVEALQARVAKLEAAARWIPVSERLPEDERRVEICTVNDDIEIARHVALIPQWGCDDGMYYHDSNYGIVIAWRELPAPYEGEK